MLLAAIATSLALIGDRAAARTSVPPAASADAGAPGFVLATNVIGALHRQVGSLSDGALEAVSLLALGVGLIAAGQLMGQKRRTRRAAAAPARPVGLAQPALRPQSSMATTATRGAAR
jgi:hypothetical protein